MIGQEIPRQKQHMQSRRYSIDLRARMAVCDANYIRILKLFPDQEPLARRVFALPFGNGMHHTLVQLKITEKFRYTSTLALTMSNDALAGIWFTPPCMLVRLYHDACTAEVVSYQETPVSSIETLAAMNRAFSINEKEEVNLFLAEWLSLCLDEGMGSGPGTLVFRSPPDLPRDKVVQEL
jgi:uncharacterized protein YqiB (DUF1249 family)